MIDNLKIFDTIRDVFEVEKILCNLYVTGSYSRNEQRKINEKSSIDILVVVPDKSLYKEINNIIFMRLKHHIIEANIKISFVFCLLDSFKKNYLSNFVICIDKENPIYDSLGCIEFTEINNTDRLSFLMQGSCYYFAKFKNNNCRISLLKSYLESLKCIMYTRGFRCEGYFYNRYFNINKDFISNEENFKVNEILKYLNGEVMLSDVIISESDVKSIIDVILRDYQANASRRLSSIDEFIFQKKQISKNYSKAIEAVFSENLGFEMTKSMTTFN